MGPTNQALLALFRVDSELRQAQADLDEATRGVRVQKKRAELATAAHADTSDKLKHAKAQQMELDSDIKSREAHIEHLRDQQQAAQNNKQYQAFLIEINNAKQEQTAIEEQSVAKLNEIDELTKQQGNHLKSSEFEGQRASDLSNQIGPTTEKLEARIAELEPERDAAAEKVPAKALAAFERISDNYDGEGMAAVGHIEGKEERYYCTACNMELVVDVYNRLMTRDEVLTCPGCGRLLYVPEDLTPDKAVRQKAVKKTRKKAAAKKTTKKVAKKTKSGIPADVKNIITTAAAESLRQAQLDETSPIQCEVKVAGVEDAAGPYDVVSIEHFQKLLNGKLQAADLEQKVTVLGMNDAESGNDDSVDNGDDTSDGDSGDESAEAVEAEA